MLAPALLLFVCLQTLLTSALDAGGARDLQEQAAARRPRTKAEARIDSHLLAAIDRELRGEASPAADRAALDKDAEGRVLLDIRADVTEALITAINDSGGIVVSRFPQYQSLRARISLGKLLALAERDDIKFIRPAEQPMNNDPAAPRKPG